MYTLSREMRVQQHLSCRWIIAVDRRCNGLIPIRHEKFLCALCVSVVNSYDVRAVQRAVNAGLAIEPSLALCTQLTIS